MNSLAVIAIVFAAGTGAALAAIARVVIRMIRRFRIQHDRLEQELAVARRELSSASVINTQISAQLGRIERDHAAILERIGTIELRGEGRPYDQAIDAARRGENPIQLSQQFGLSHGEAELIRLLHGRRRAEAA